MAVADQPLDEVVTNSKRTFMEEWFGSLKKAIEDGQNKALRRGLPSTLTASKRLQRSPSASTTATSQISKSRLLNLVAYEMCADVPEEYTDVTSYLCFLEGMIDSAEDVKELRSHGILINYLGIDRQVAHLFNGIADELVPNYAVYASVNQQIEKHYQNKFKIWVLERLSTHFKAPWSRVSFVAALIALVLSFLQTFYAIKQSKV